MLLALIALFKAGEWLLDWISRYYLCLVSGIIVHYIKTKQTQYKSYYLAGFPQRDGIYFAKGYIYSKLGTRYTLVFEGQPHSVKPALAKQFLDKHPSINGYASSGWMNYLNIRERSPYDQDVLGSFRSALELFRAQYGYEARWVMVFSVAR